MHRLEVMAMEIADSKTGQVRDRLEALRFLVQIYEDEMSLFLYGPSHFLVKDPASASASAATASGSSDAGVPENPLRNRQAKPLWPWGIDDIDEDEEGTDDDFNAVF